ncbi:MAG: MerR family transcriptional regulator, partial [Actinobacteria bacterium]|nr:MerR family transcriptional regulator [Actinomycetota bacterium]
MDERISLTEAARRSGVPAPTLKRWAAEDVVPLSDGYWTPAAAAQARVVARMRERGYSLEDLKEAGREGRLDFGIAEELFVDDEEAGLPLETVAAETGLEVELIERILTMMGTPVGRERNLSVADAA